jgi:hypothetical protein
MPEYSADEFCHLYDMSAVAPEHESLNFAEFEPTPGRLSPRPHRPLMDSAREAT